MRATLKAKARAVPERTWRPLQRPARYQVATTTGSDRPM